MGKKNKVSIQKLVNLQGYHFIRSAFQSLLDRQVTPIEEKRYYERMIKGISKFLILGEILNYSERRGKEFGSFYERAIFIRYKIYKMPVIGKTTTFINNILLGGFRRKRMRATENQSFLGQQQTFYKLDLLNEELCNLNMRNHIEQERNINAMRRDIREINNRITQINNQEIPSNTTNIRHTNIEYIAENDDFIERYPQIDNFETTKGKSILKHILLFSGKGK